MIIQPQEYSVINKFITKIFNYYNGKINIFNPGRLIIEWCGMYKYHSLDAGYSRLPNQVIINPNVILRESKTAPDFKYYIIETVIHELYHTDQIISFSRMDEEPYKLAMEAANEIQVLTYIANNLHELRECFGIDVNMSDHYINKNLHKYDMYRFPYHRRRLHDHVFMMIDECLFVSPDEREGIRTDIAKYLSHPETNVVVTINSATLNLKTRASIVDINQINDFFYFNLFRFDHTKNVNTVINANTKTLRIDISTGQQLNDMIIL